MPGVKEEAHGRGGGGVGDPAAPVDELDGVVVEGVDAFGVGEGGEQRGDGVVVHGVAVVDGDGVGPSEQAVGGGDEDRVAQDQVGDDPFGFVSLWCRKAGRVEGRRGGQEAVVGGDETVGVLRAAGGRRLGRPAATHRPLGSRSGRRIGRGRRRCGDRQSPDLRAEASLREVLGDEAALSKSTASRICQQVKEVLAAFAARELSGLRLDYLVLDGSNATFHEPRPTGPVLCAVGHRLRSPARADAPVMEKVKGPGGDFELDRDHARPRLAAWSSLLGDPASARAHNRARARSSAIGRPIRRSQSR